MAELAQFSGSPTWPLRIDHVWAEFVLTLTLLETSKSNQPAIASISFPSHSQPIQSGADALQTHNGRLTKRKITICNTPVAQGQEKHNTVNQTYYKRLINAQWG
ncbi:unnamed protein product [Nippostrongylus brasiliensis]|uniref:Uncharacterized protein n=1 Tax=Nippostrongylus brasiliensis TaxID=27835 RepID=A0A0N4XUD3_NIPBR|nr:unnamed protein product [Nippostrongylus brasiliensis]